MTKTPLLNRAALEKYALSLSISDRAGKFTRVGDDFFVKAESALRQWANSYIHGLPSVGKTIK